MALALSEEQELIAQTAADFAAGRSPVSRLRALRDAADPVGFSRGLWKEMAELGWVGIPFPEALGGAGMGLAELSIVLEALGRKLAPEPFLSSVLLAGQALLLGGDAAQQKEWLAPMIQGSRLLALGFQEAGSRYDLSRVATRAERSGEGWRLSGCKIQVLDGHVADAFVVSARTSGNAGEAEGVSLLLVPADAPGVCRERQSRLDQRGAALVHFDRVEVPRAALVGDLDCGGRLLEEVVDRATAGLCAEMVGGMSEAFALTLDHLKQREQFGVRIGSFQALKHRAARVFIELELARSAAMAAARAVDENTSDRPSLVSLAKARCSEAYVLATNEAVQMFGGVGMTDEYDIGFYMKRARAAELSFGDAAFHRDRWARLSGY